MAEKTACWCGKALVYGYIKDATRDHPAMGCPVHGENWRLSQEQVIALVAAVRAWGKIGGAMALAGVQKRYVDDFHRALGLNNAALALLPKGE